MSYEHIHMHKCIENESTPRRSTKWALPGRVAARSNPYFQYTILYSGYKRAQYGVIVFVHAALNQLDACIV